MVEPAQKRRKDWGLKGEHNTPSTNSTNLFKYVTTHKTNPAMIDLTEFSIGMEQPRLSNRARWNGAFEGRHNLIEELAPFIKIFYGNSPISSVRTLQNTLRTWWRLLDEYHDIAPVFSVVDLKDFHGAMQMREGVSGDITNAFLKLVNAALSERGLSNLFWVKNARKTSETNLPDEKSVALLYQEMKKRVHAVIDRWAEFDAVKWDGKDWSDCINLRPQNLRWTIEDSFATFQGVARKSGNPCPSRKLCATHLSLVSMGSKFFDHYQGIVYGLFPSRNDVQDILTLIVLKTGWNGQVAIDIDGENLEMTIRDHPSSEAHHFLYSNKNRGNTEQVAAGLKRSELSPANLIALLAIRTKPLKDFLENELGRTSNYHEKLGPDNDSIDRVQTLRRWLASVWLYVQRDDSEISILTSQNYALGPDGKKSAMFDLIQKVNLKNKDFIVSSDITLPDFRDAFLSFSYEYTGYSWLETKLMAGQSNINSLTTYLRKQKWKNHGDCRIRGFLNNFWDEIRARRIADPAILRAMADRGEISESQRIRWMEHKDRTRVGMGCRDFKNPPKDIAPEHVKGSGCNIQRCTLCGHGVIFEDSLDHLARRLAELSWIKCEIPLVSWYQSSFPLEVEATESALKNFAPASVEERLEFWGEEIRVGRHVPIIQEGIYGKKG